MDKYKLIGNIKNNENEFLKENAWNDRFYVKENNTPNRIPANKTRAHIKIKSRDIKNINLNIFTEDESNPKVNITSNLNNDNRLYPSNKKKVKSNKTFSNLLTIKLHKKDKKNIININKHKINIINNNETYKKIINLWEELGVNYVYQSIFNKISSNLNIEKRDNYFLYEYNKLNNIKNIINLIIEDINNRELKLLELQQNYFYKNEENEENNNFDEDIIKQELSLLIDIRKLSIDIVNNILLLRKEIGYDIIMNKYDINKIFIFPNDYLVKMNNDLDFLINSNLNKYFNFAKSDPFLIKINNDKYQIPELKDEDKINIMNNFENIIFDELINQEVNLMTINSKSSFDSIFNFTSKNKILKKNNTLLNNEVNNNVNMNIPKKKNIITNKIIKANRGLSSMKLRPKISNKLVIDAENSKISNNRLETTFKNKITKINTNTINNNNYKNSNNNFFNNEKSNKGDYIPSNVKCHNIKNNTIIDDDIKIFERIIEQSIIEKNNIDNEIFDNKMKKNRLNKIKKNKKEDKNKNSNISIKNKNKIKENEELNNSLNDNIKADEIIIQNNIKGEKLKNQISNFIKDILEESEIENSQKKSISKNKVLNTESVLINNEEYNLDNIEIEAEPIKKIYENITIELYRDKLSTLKKIYNEYYKKIPEKLKIGFNIQSNIFNYIEGIYPKILLYKSNKNYSQVLGIVTLNYLAYNPNSIVIGKAKTNNYNKILNISSISCINESQFEDILINTLDFCQEFFYFEHIILQLYYLNKNGQFFLYSDLEKIIKNKAKFKWINMENDGIDRKIKYRYTNNNYDTIKNNVEFHNNIINLKTINIIGFENEKNYNNMDIRKLSFINDFSVNYLLLEMVGQNNFKVNDKKNGGNNYVNSLINKVTFKKMNHLCCDFLMSQFGEACDIKKFLKENENFFNNSEIIKKIDQRIYYELYFGLAIININSSFKNIIKRKYNGYIYNILFNDQINEFSIKDNNNNDMQFYLIKSSDQNTSIIIYEFKKNESLENIIKLLYNENNTNNKNEENEKNTSEIFKELFAKVTKKPSKIDKNIYIPSFKIILNKLAFRPSVFSDIILENDENYKNYKINCLNFIEELTFGNDEPFINQQNLMDLDDILRDNIIIQNDFIISIVDNDLIFELQIPTVSSFLIKKKYWIKSS